ncbi:MAG: GAF domain-containing protein, partial [Acidobacteria bacterium]|nr:GAF domain-containing protein [Acidobacteriota bacterium]
EQLRKQIDHTGRLSAVLSIQQEITSREPDLEEVLSLISNRAITILGATGSAIALQRDGSMVCRANGGATGPALGAHLSSEFGLSGECLRTGQPVLCNDVDKDPRVDTSAARALGIRSLIVVPVFHHRTTVGVFEVFSSESEFFDKEDAHVVELLGGMITTAISYSSEFEAKQTLESERSAMLEVIERITPTITRMLEQHSAVPPETAPETESAQFDDALHSDVKEEAADSSEMDFGEDVVFGAVPGATGPVPLEATDSVAAAEAAPVDTQEVEAEEQSVEPGVQVAEVEDAAAATGENPDREQRALKSAIDILLAKEQVLEPESADSEQEPTEEEASEPLFAPARRPLSQPPVAEPLLPPVSAEHFDWPDPEAPPLPQGCDREPFLSQTAGEDAENSTLGNWSPPALLQSRRPASAPDNQPTSIMASPASTTEFFTLSHDLPAIPPAGTQPASKAVGAPLAPLGRSRGGTTLALRLRNVMEYVVPAVLTGLLIVIGLQWLSSNQRIPTLLGSKGLKALPPTLFAPAYRTPVEVSLLKVPGTSGLSHTGKEINNRVSAVVAWDRGATADWSDSAKNFGKRLGEKLPNLPSTTAESDLKNNAALSGIEQILPSNSSVSNTGNAVKNAAENLTGPVATLRLPEEVIDDYVLVRVQPMYPQVARQNNITGTV